eukprot:GILK01013837.1.p1 GENE.GILK01013837.1~~GILK01013837.1.p1  ORF type:complete len:216 (+),score=28.58 GILK01013837.1:164-811(+)
MLFTVEIKFFVVFLSSSQSVKASEIKMKYFVVVACLFALVVADPAVNTLAPEAVKVADTAAPAAVAPADTPAAPANGATTVVIPAANAVEPAKTAEDAHTREKLTAICLGCMNNIEAKLNELSHEGHELDDKTHLDKGAQDLAHVANLMDCVNSSNYPNCLPKPEPTFLQTDTETGFKWWLYSVPYPVSYVYTNPWWSTACSNVFSYYGWGLYLW